MRRRAINLFIALDQFLFCCITLGNSDPDETASSAAYRMERDGKFFGFMRPVIDTILWFDKEHCKASYEAEIFLRNAYLEASKKT